LAKVDKGKAEKEARETIKKAKMEAKDIKRKAKLEAKEIKKNAQKQAREIRRKKGRINKERKDKFLHTRVPEDLEREIKERAEQMRIPVSVLIRNILEDAFK
jgi:predicted DNA binding CopG/RHH family protein